MSYQAGLGQTASAAGETRQHEIQATSGKLCTVHYCNCTGLT